MESPSGTLDEPHLSPITAIPNDGNGMCKTSEPKIPAVPYLASSSPSAISPYNGSPLRLTPITRATSMPLDESVGASHSGLLDQGQQRNQIHVDIYRGHSQPLPSLSAPRQLESKPLSDAIHPAGGRYKRPSVTGQIRESENSLITLDMERLIEKRGLKLSPVETIEMGYSSSKSHRSDPKGLKNTSNTSSPTSPPSSSLLASVIDATTIPFDHQCQQHRQQQYASINIMNSNSTRENGDGAVFRQSTLPSLSIWVPPHNGQTQGSPLSSPPRMPPNLRGDKPINPVQQLSLLPSTVGQPGREISPGRAIIDSLRMQRMSEPSESEAKCITQFVQAESPVGQVVQGPFPPSSHSSTSSKGCPEHLPRIQSHGSFDPLPTCGPERPHEPPSPSRMPPRLGGHHAVVDSQTSIPPPLPLRSSGHQEVSPQRGIIEALKAQRLSEPSVATSSSPRSNGACGKKTDRHSDMGQAPKPLKIIGYYNSRGDDAEGLDYHCLDKLPAPIHTCMRPLPQLDHAQGVVLEDPLGSSLVASKRDGSKPHHFGMLMDVDAHLASGSPKVRQARLDPEQLSSLPRLPQLTATVNPTPPKGPSPSSSRPSPERPSPESRIRSQGGLSWEPPPFSYQPMDIKSETHTLEGSGGPPLKGNTGNLSPITHPTMDPPYGERPTLQPIGGVSLKTWVS